MRLEIKFSDVLGIDFLGTSDMSNTYTPPHHWIYCTLMLVFVCLFLTMDHFRTASGLALDANSNSIEYLYLGISIFYLGERITQNRVWPTLSPAQLWGTKAGNGVGGHFDCTDVAWKRLLHPGSGELFVPEWQTLCCKCGRWGGVTTPALELANLWTEELEGLRKAILVTILTSPFGYDTVR